MHLLLANCLGLAEIAQIVAAAQTEAAGTGWLIL